MPGTVYTVQPQPPDEAHTTWFAAGVLEVGVEYRVVDPASLRATYAGDAEAMAEIEEHSPDGGFFDAGVSIHVRRTSDGHEHLRFDAFDGDPHYHYVRPTGDHNNVVPFDRVADGDMVHWAFDRLRHRLAEMLGEAGGADVALQVDPARWAATVDLAEALADEAVRLQRRPIDGAGR